MYMIRDAAYLQGDATKTADRATEIIMESSAPIVGDGWLPIFCSEYQMVVEA